MQKAIMQKNYPIPINANLTGSFANKTVVERLPTILDTLIYNKYYPVNVKKNLKLLKAELVGGYIKPLRSFQPDTEEWNELINKTNGKWLEVSWYFAESLFYRKLIEAVDYFGPGPWMRIDPFQDIKSKQALKDFGVFEEHYQRGLFHHKNQFLTYLFKMCLIGNQIDLSNFIGTASNLEKDWDEFIVINDVERINYFFTGKTKAASYFLDNVGLELFFDLSLIEYLLSNKYVDNIFVHLKNNPFFVSDAMPKDLFESLRMMVDSKTRKIQKVGENLKKYISESKIVIKTHPFWTSGNTFYNTPKELMDEFQGVDVLISKGDLNYRRLLGDLQWKFTTNTKKALNYLPTSCIMLRMMKSEILTGIHQKKIEQLSNLDREWVTNGKKGIIQIVAKN